MEAQDRDFKNVAVSLDSWRELKQRALDSGISLREVVDRLVAKPAVESHTPAEGWKAPAATTAMGRFGVPAAEMVSPPHRGRKAGMGPAVSKPDLQAKVDAARPVPSYRVDPLNPRAGKSAKAAIGTVGTSPALAVDPDDVEF